jgi:hypothetical protein
MSKARRIVLICIVIGYLIYLTRLFRENFEGRENVLYWLGFIPNFGLSFALSFILYVNKDSFFKQLKFNFYKGCLIVFAIMILNEIVDKYQPRRVFDWMDIWASLVGVLCAAFVYYFVLKNEESEI